MTDDDLNADAIYAALVWMRDYAESEQGLADFDNLLERRAAKVEGLATLAQDAGASLHPVPAFKFTPEFIESIYPGERDSVEFGLNLGRWMVYSPSAFASFSQRALRDDDPVSVAIRRFVADRAH